MQVAGDSNKKEGEAFLAANKSKPGVVTLPSGLQYKILKEGTGPKPTASDSVVCNYRGTLSIIRNLTAPTKRGQPATFPVGQVIHGWTEALQAHAVGSKWQLFIPSDFGLWRSRRRRRYWTNATLVFEVECFRFRARGSEKNPRGINGSGCSWILPMLTLGAIREAAERIHGSVVVTPFVRSEKFSQLTENSVFLKLEKPTNDGRVQGKGRAEQILLLTEEERRRGVIAASAGNHAQAVAYHATKRGIKAQICMPLTTRWSKYRQTRGYGAEVILAGANYDEACEEALRRSKQFGLTFIHPFDDEAVIAGQGTLGIEMLEQHTDLDALVIPVGGGGLIAGVACAVKEINPKIQVIGVQSSKLASMKAALEKNELVTLPANKTIAGRNRRSLRRCAHLSFGPQIRR